MNPESAPFYTLSAEETLRACKSQAAGLSAAQAEERLARCGHNELSPPPPISPLGIFLRQFKNLLILILIAATMVSFLLGEYLDAVVILAILMACGVLGFCQEYRAERAAAALRDLAAPMAAVLRDGEEKVIPAREVVPGDILVLHTGDKVAADGRLLTAINLMADESVLTGESSPVGKDPAPLPWGDIAIADQACMVFEGTVISYGRGQALVTATGMATEFGRIAGLLQAVEEEHTPLERRMHTIGRVLSVICLTVAAGASLLGVLRGYGWLEMLIWGISLAVAAVPEALPAVVTGALAIGTSRMAKRHAIVKRLPAVETMGCTTVICTDKTGTLTRNEMTARQLYLSGRLLKVSGTGYAPEGAVKDGETLVIASGDPVLAAAGRIALLCNDAFLYEEGGGWKLRGDPTEGALLVLARKAGLNPEAIKEAFPRLAEIPFTAERQMMTTLHQGPEAVWAALKGAPEAILSRSSRLLTGEGERPLADGDRDATLAQAEAMAARALRVLGLAYRNLETLPEPSPAAVETDLVWVGLAGLMDPPRPEARAAVSQCREAGIRVIMVTGDHPHTSGAIAREVGLLAPGEEARVVTGTDLHRLSESDLEQALKEVKVFARVAPEHKLRLVNALKAQGEVVAMTGDGVNDAPSLKKADIGVAMGLAGTEVTKETAAMILADDNFATLVAAVEEGRAIFDNIKKYLIFLLSCNLAEILVLTGAFFVGMPLPLIAIQILMVNLTTDGLPALALGVDPKAPDIMRRPPRPPRESIFSQPVNMLLALISVHLTLILGGVFAGFYYLNPRGLADPEATLILAQTMIFVTMVLSEMVNAFNCRSDTHSLFTVGVWQNRFLVVSVAISVLITVAIVQWEPLALIFRTTPLTGREWLLALGLSLTALPVVEAAKWWLRRG